jgi:hypothetical protein
MYHRAVSERPDLTLNDFVQHRKALRGKLVYLDLNVRLVQKADVKTSDGYELYELWGFTTESGSWLYCVMAVGLPKDIDVGARVEQHVRVAGYFLKLQGYYPALGKPNDMHFAPMVIGRAWRVVPPPPLAKENLSVPLALGVLGGFVALLAAWAIWGVVKKRRKGSVRPVAAGGGRTLPIDDWFERAEAGNNPQGIPDSSHRPSGRNGDGNGEAAPFPDGLDSGPSKSE